MELALAALAELAMTRLATLVALALLLGGGSCSSGPGPGAAPGGAAGSWGLGGRASASPPPSGSAAPASPASSYPATRATSSPHITGTVRHLPDRSAHPPSPDLDWTGWRLHPALPTGCRGVYVPDSVTKREKPLRWEPCPASLGISCQELVDNRGADVWSFPGTGAVWPGGTQPDFILFAYVHQKSKVLEFVIYDATGQPVAALREDTWGDGSAYADIAPDVSPDGKLVSLQMSLGMCGSATPETVLVAPADDPAALMYSTRPTLTWSRTFLGHQDVQEVVVSHQLAAAMLIGAAMAGDLATGKSVMITPPPHGSVDWDPYYVLGRTVLLLRGTPETSIWVSQDLGMAKPLLQVPGESFSLATDGKTMVWVEYSDVIEPQQGWYAHYAHHDVYMAPYTTDPDQLQKTKKWIGRVPTSWDGLEMFNGYVIGCNYESTYRRCYVLHLADRKWSQLVLPSGWYGITQMSFASPIELWTVAAYGATGNELYRVPFSALTPRDFTQGGPP